MEVATSVWSSVKRAFMTEPVTACMIVMNERQRIGPALESVRFCDAVIVVDGGSTDGTAEYASTFGAHVVHNPWPGYARQRNVALDLARTDWVLELDADERVPPALRSEIQAFLAAPPVSVDMAVIPLRDIFLGKALGPASKYPMYRGRLFRRGSYRHDERRSVHEGLWPNGEVHPFREDLVHILASSWREALDDCVRYARLEAGQRPRPGLARILVDAIVRPLAKAGYRVVILGGWRDGLRGAARIGFECVSDSLACILARRGSGAAAGHGEAANKGSMRVVGFAVTDTGARAGIERLRALSALGADVALVGPTLDDEDIRIRRVKRLAPISMVRGIEAEAQVRPIDAIVPYDTGAALVALILRPRLRRLVRRVEPGRHESDLMDAVSRASASTPQPEEVP
jgi:hypothetical protein